MVLLMDPREPLGNFERLFVLHIKQQKQSLTAPPPKKKQSIFKLTSKGSLWRLNLAQVRGLVLVEQGVLVATEWRSQELPLAKEAAHHMLGNPEFRHH